MARKPRIISKTGIYHVIIRCYEGEDIFADNANKDQFLEVLQQCKTSGDYQIYGYSILDGHLHLLLKAGSVSLSTLMKRIGVKYSSWYNEKYGRIGKLFYDRFKSEPIENDEYLVKSLRFIHQEPVRQGIVLDVNRYAYSSQHCYNSDDSLVDTDYILSYFGGSRVQFNKFINEPAEDKCLETARDKVSNEDVAEQLLRVAEIESVDELHQMPKAQRDAILRSIKAVKGVTIAQLARISGFSESIVSRA